MREQTVTLLEARILEAIERMRGLAAERGDLAAEVERLRGEMAAWSDDGSARTRGAREALRQALTELRGD